MVLYVALLPVGYRATPPALLLFAGALVIVLMGRPQWHSVEGVPNLTVLCWNVGLDFPHLRQAAEDLQALDWDIALLQEVGLSPTDDVGKELLKLMPVAHAVRGGYEGELMVLSRKAPLRNPREFLVADLRQELEVDVALGERVLRLANIHLVRSDYRHPTGPMDSARMRARQVRQVLERECDLVGGDFNLPASADPMELMRDRYQDAFETAGRGFGMTYPRPVPLWRIDGVFVGDAFEVCDCRTLTLRASDHKALLTRLRVLPLAPARTPPPPPSPLPEPD
jgi:endonuclease/exonuclease/phosphatase (EEP) superfamily protein YafD